MSKGGINSIAALVEQNTPFPEEADIVFLWDDYQEGNNIVSIPFIVERDFQELRKAYLNWTTDLANTAFREATLKEYLMSEMLNGESYWWQTLIADKCPYKTKTPYDVIRLHAFEKRFLDGAFNELIYTGTNRILASMLKEWVEERLSGKFQWKQVRKTDVMRRPFYNRIPKLIQAFTYLVHFTWSRLRHVKKIVPDADAHCTIVTYFPGIDLQKASDKVFRSNYWGPLHDHLEKYKISVNWIWIYGNLQQLSYAETVAFQKRLNVNPLSGRYLMLENFLSARTLIVAIKEYLVLYVKSFSLCQIKNNFHFHGSSLNFYKLLEDDWLESFRGHTALLNCIHGMALKQAGKELPKDTKLIIYIWENQPWEQALLATRRYLKNAMYIGSVHTPGNSAVYNLKVFPGNPSELNSQYGRLMPDIIGAPGKIPAGILKAGGWPGDKVQPVEALRYMESLNPLKISVRSPDDLKETALTLLVVTGSIETECRTQINFLAQAERKGALKRFAEIIVKPHPSIQVDVMIKEAGFQISCSIQNTKLRYLWNKVDYVYASNSTSVSVEAAYLGFPLIITGATDNLNINPLFGTGYVHFVHSADELAAELCKKNHNVTRLDGFFNLAEDLPVWASYFKQAGVIDSYLQQ